MTNPFFIHNQIHSMTSISPEEYKYRYQTLQTKLRYYTKLESSKGQLTPKQQAKYTELINQLNELESNKPDDLPTRKKYSTYEEYLQANKEHAKQRYHRVKDTTEHKQYQKEYYQSHYVHKRKPKINNEEEEQSSSE